MHSVGIDLHRKRSHVAVIDDQGRELRSRRIINDGQTILALLAEIDGDCRVALEATYGWEWLADVLEDAGYELHLAHPLRTKAIASARVKTGVSEDLCRHGRTGASCLPEPTAGSSWRPPSVSPAVSGASPQGERSEALATRCAPRSGPCRRAGSPGSSSMTRSIALGWGWRSMICPTSCASA
jgi:hypothetical protein